jgi:hypothetical protein
MGTVAVCPVRSTRYTPGSSIAPKCIATKISGRGWAKASSTVSGVSMSRRSRKVRALTAGSRATSR